MNAFLKWFRGQIELFYGRRDGGSSSAHLLGQVLLSDGAGGGSRTPTAVATRQIFSQTGGITRSFPAIPLSH